MANETQLLYGGERKTNTQAVSITRGDVKDFTFSHDLGAEAAVESVLFTLRVPSSDDTGQAVLQLTLTDHAAQFDLTTDDYCTITFLADDTKTLPIGTYTFGVQMTDLDSLPYTPVKGPFVLDEDVVHDDITVGYPTWDTLGDIQDQLAALLVACNASLVTVAAALGASVITVDDGTIFTAGDTIWVHISGATYEEHTIDAGGVDGNELTLVGTLAAACPVGAVVQIEASA